MTSVVENQIKSIIVRQLGVKEGDISSDKSFTDDFGADSLDVVELVLAIEDEFKLTIPDEEAADLRTVGDAVNYITTNKG